MQFQSEVNLENYGWMLDDDNDNLGITRMRSNAAPGEVTLQVLFSPQNNFWILSRGVSIVTS